jgi:hypothetical protein
MQEESLWFECMRISTTQHRFDSSAIIYNICRPLGSYLDRYLRTSVKFTEHTFHLSNASNPARPDIQSPSRHAETAMNMSIRKKNYLIVLRGKRHTKATTPDESVNKPSYETALYGLVAEHCRMWGCSASSNQDLPGSDDHSAF